MTAEPTGEVMWSPDPIRQRLAVYTLEDVLKRRDRLVADSTEELVLTAPFDIRLPVRDIAP